MPTTQIKLPTAVSARKSSTRELGPNPVPRLPLDNRVPLVPRTTPPDFANDLKLGNGFGSRFRGSLKSMARRTHSWLAPVPVWQIADSVDEIVIQQMGERLKLTVVVGDGGRLAVTNSPFPVDGHQFDEQARLQTVVRLAQKLVDVGTIASQAPSPIKRPAYPIQLRG